MQLEIRQQLDDSKFEGTCTVTLPRSVWKETGKRCAVTPARSRRAFGKNASGGERRAGPNREIGEAAHNRRMRLPEKLESCVRPIVVETGIEGAAHAAWGSSFLVGYRGRSFVITARHVLRPDGDLAPLCVRSPSGKLFRPKDVFFVPADLLEEDYADIAVVELDTRRLTGDLGATNIIPLDLGDGDWDNFKEVSQFVVMGFPHDHTFVDYDTGEVVEGLVHLDGQYVGPSETNWIHVMHVHNPPPLTTFSGFSGAPVFMIKRQIGCPAVSILVGMALQGSVESGFVRFVDRARIVDMVRSKLEGPASKGGLLPVVEYGDPP